METYTCVILLGNDGVGKSSLTSELNKYAPVKTMFFERSMTTFTSLLHQEIFKNITIQIKQFDKATLFYTWEDRPQVPEPQNIPELNITCSFKYVTIDADIDVIMNRLSTRNITDIWETKKAIEYFSYRFRELSSYYGFPLIKNNGDLTPLEVSGIIIKTLKTYDHINMFATSKLTREYLASIDIETTLITLLNEHAFDIQFSESELEELQPITFTSLNAFKARKLIDEQHMHITDTCVRFIYNEKILYELPMSAYVYLVREGESKKIYRIVSNNPYYNDMCIILLKSTIYSHSKQATGEIQNLGAIRGQGTQLYLEMMARNGLKHCYRSVNSYGVIIADYLNSIPETEIVGKFNCEGTDKHSYYGLRTNSLLVKPSGEYNNGLYIRTDWRNPNHIYNTSKRAVTENKYYYPAETIYGKEQFFTDFIKPYCTPIGDKVIDSNIITDKMQNMSTTRKTTFQIMHTIRSILNKVGLTVLDACFMLDKTGTIFWSEINQDCMRIIALDNKDIRFDKDIWRAGGSSAKDAIMAKWTEFNNIIIDYFKTHRIENELKTYYEYNYEESMRNSGIQYRKKNKQIAVFTTNDTISSMNIFPDIILYMPDNTNIKTYENTMNYYCFVQGCTTKETLIKLIQHSARRIIIDTTHTELLELLPPNRVILKFTSSEPDIINKYESYDSIMIPSVNPIYLCQYNKQIKKVYTYVTVLNHHELPTLMKLDRVIPIITHMTKHDIIRLMVCENENTNKINCSLQDKTGHIINFKQYTIDELLSMSNNPDVMKISPNKNDNSNVIITFNKHMKDNYNTQSIIKANILTLDNDIDKIINTDNSQQLLAKIMCGFYNISALGNNDISNCSTFLLNFMAYMKTNGITIDDCLNKCNAEKWNLFKPIPVIPCTDYYAIGITGNKYYHKTDAYILNQLGIKIIRATGRKLMINYEIIDAEKYKNAFNKPVIFIPMRPKDMPYQCANGNLDGFITYNSVFDNAPNIGIEKFKYTDMDLKICLIKKKTHTVSKHIKVAAEHYKYVKDYFNKNTEYTTIDINYVIGSSESYVVNGIMDYADAVVETGNSLNDNDLEVVANIKHRGSLYIALVMAN